MPREDLLFVPVLELAGRIRERKLSPVELAESCLDRSSNYAARFNAFATVTREAALEQARKAEAEIAAGRYRGPLHGIPYGAKDLVATSGGIPTTWGAAPFKDRVS